MTQQGDEKAWDAFVSWCEARGLTAVPAHPWTLAAYARWCERRHRYPAIAKAVRAIARVHNTKSRRRPERHPVVKRTLRLIESRAKARKKTRAGRPALFPEDDLADAGQAAPAGAAKAESGAQTKAKTKAKTGAKRGGLSAAPKLVPRRRLKK